MRKFLALFAVIHLVLIGCNGLETPTSTESEKITLEPEPAGPPATAMNPLTTFWVDDSEVRVRGYELDTVSHEVMINLSRIDPNEEPEDYVLVVQKTRIANCMVYNGASLLDADGNLLVGLDYTWPDEPLEPNLFVVTERTPFDVLHVQYEIEKGVVNETYTLNGAARSFKYLDDIPNQARTNPYMPVTDEQVELLRQEVVDKLVQWDDLISPENTLNYNPEGEFFVKVLGNGDFQAWAEQVFQEEGNLNKMTIGSRDAVCAVAAGIVFLKCWGTWYGNFLCWASLGTGVACLIGIVGRWIHGWD